ncbi:MAG: hypothetical protein JWR01_2937 [Subtercola sp.]|nr:hypothetical protein [Subtercola sp.]
MPCPPFESARSLRTVVHLLTPRLGAIIGYGFSFANVHICTYRAYVAQKLDSMASSRMKGGGTPRPSDSSHPLLRLHDRAHVRYRVDPARQGVLFAVSGLAAPVPWAYHGRR